MTILAALKTPDANLRLSAGGNRWMFYDGATDEWVVREWKPHQRKLHELIRTPDEERAVEVLKAD